MSSLQLRRVEAVTHARVKAVQGWRQAGQGAGLGRLAPQTTYLGFCAGDWRGLVSPHEWLQHTLPQLHAWMPGEGSATSIAHLFQSVPQPLLPQVQALRYQALTEIELVTGQALPGDDLPWLDTPRGRVWVTQLPTRRPVSEQPPSTRVLQDLPLHLQWLLGISYLTHGSLARLGQGDVLRMEHRIDRCLLANRCIGVFTFTEEGLHMQATVADQAIAAPDELTTLPVRLEFLLASQATDLGTLARILDGQLIALPSDAARHIEIRANGKSVARGELVQLDDGLGIEVLQVYAAEQSR